MSILTEPPHILCPECNNILINEPNKRTDIMQADIVAYFCYICPNCELVFALPKDTISQDYKIKGYPFYMGPTDKNAFRIQGWKTLSFNDVQHDEIKPEKKEPATKSKEKCFLCDEETANMKRHINNKHEWFK